MNTLEPITISLLWAKECAQVGLPQKGSIFCWIEFPNGQGARLTDSDNAQYWRNKIYEGTAEGVCVYAAWTAEEILKITPEFFEEDGQRCYLNIFPAWTVRYSKPDPELGSLVKCYGQDISLANAAAIILCYLKEHNLLPAQQ